MNTIIDPNVVLSEMEFPEIDIFEKPMQIDSSDNDSVISTFSEDYSFITKKHVKKPVGLGGRVSSSLPIEIADILFLDEEVVNEDFSEISSEEEDLSDQDIDFNAPALELENMNNQKESIDFNDNFMWVALWILKHQKRYRLSDVASNSFMKLIRYLLNYFNVNKCSFFPSSLNKVRDALGVCTHMIKYATCKKCCKLYNVADLSTDKPNIIFKISHCTYQEFPNHLMANQ